MNAITPVPSIIPESAPFSPDQRAWLNGFFAAYLGVETPVASDAAAPDDEAEEDFPWHDAALAMAERLELARALAANPAATEVVTYEKAGEAPAGVAGMLRQLYERLYQ